jgi:hypothetical protein
MSSNVLSSQFLKNAWEVLLLFTVPIGGGIPAGVVLAKNREIPWQIMCGLYFISDIILACAFEPIMLLFIHYSKTNPHLARIRVALKKVTDQSVGRFGLKPGPFTLILITFGTDPMTGRSVAKASGHGFFAGWALTIAGDMIFFVVLMASTLWLDNILGNGTLAAIIIVVLMLILPPLIRRIWRWLNSFLKSPPPNS